MRNATTKTTAAADCGFWKTAVMTDTPEGIIAQDMIRSVAGPAVSIAFESEMAKKEGLRVEFAGNKYFLGELALRQSPQPISPKNRKRDLNLVRLLILSALAKAGARGDIATLSTGLPVSWYKEDHLNLESILIGKAGITINGKNVEMTIQNVITQPQPWGSLMNSITTPEGKMQDPHRLAAKKVGVIDIGHLTADLILSDSLEYIGNASDSTDGAGAVAFYELLQREIRTRYDEEKTIDEVAEAAKTGKIVVWGRSVTIPPDMINGCIETTSRTLVQFAQDLWPRAKSYDAILVTGGASALFFEPLRASFPSARLVDDPQTANVRGFYNWAKIKNG